MQNPFENRLTDLDFADDLLGSCGK